MRAGIAPYMIQSPASAFPRYAESVRPQIDRALDEYTRFGTDCPADLAEAIRYSVLAPGKRLRPLLVLMAAEACGGSLEGALPAACAVEMIHAYSLIHDDLPAMDDDDLRRGRPTSHKIFGEALAILAGDALQSLAFEIVARDIQPPEVAAACVRVLANAAGPCALVGGQADDLAGERQDMRHSGDLATLESIHRRKTGTMFLASLRLGALAARADESRLIALEEYGRKIGLAFQIMDDLLDVYGDASAAGKRVGKDANRGKLTFPGLLGISASQRRAASLVDEARCALDEFGPAALELRDLARYITERDR